MNERMNERQNDYRNPSCRGLIIIVLHSTYRNSSLQQLLHSPGSEHCTALAVQTIIDYSRAAVMHNPPEASAPWCLVSKVMIARASRWATSPTTPPLVGRRVKNGWEIDFERLYCISGATTETEVFRGSCFCSDRAVLTRLVQSYTQQLVTMVRSGDLAPRSEKRE